MTEPIELDQDLVVPHRIIKVGMASEGNEARPANEQAQPDTVKDVVGRRALAAVREDGGDIPAATGDMYPGEHRYAYDLEVGDKLLHLDDPTPEIGEWISVRQVEIVQVGGVNLEAVVEGETQTGYPITLTMKPNAQVRIVTNERKPHG